MTAARGHSDLEVCLLNIPKYYIVESSALPEIFLKVAEAKRMLEAGEVKTVNNAVQQVGISRSAFYKYKDTIRPFNDMLHGRIVTIQVTLRNVPGSISKVLDVIGNAGGNILTLNQNIPNGGSCITTIGFETSSLKISLEEIMIQIRSQRTALRCEVLAG